MSRRNRTTGQSRARRVRETRLWLVLLSLAGWQLPWWARLS